MICRSQLGMERRLISHEKRGLGAISQLVFGCFGHDDRGMMSCSL